MARGRWWCPSLAAHLPLTPSEGGPGTMGHPTQIWMWPKRWIAVWPREWGSCRPTLGPWLRGTPCLRRRSSLHPDGGNRWNQVCTVRSHHNGDEDDLATRGSVHQGWEARLISRYLHTAPCLRLHDHHRRWRGSHQGENGLPSEGTHVRHRVVWLGLHQDLKWHLTKSAGAGQMYLSWWGRVAQILSCSGVALGPFIPLYHLHCRAFGQ